MSEVATAIIYFGSMWILPEYFDMHFVLTRTFAYKVAIIVAVSSLPLYVIKALHHRLNPAAYAKVNES
jgi:phospholipid-translocating ATPase